MDNINNVNNNVTEHNCRDEMMQIVNEINDNYKGSRVTGPTELLPFLYIGSLEDACNLGQLSELGITHVLDCASPERTLLPNCGYTTVYRRMQLNADDDLTYKISDHFDTAIRFIDDARRSEGKVLVHCIQGINRSAAICVAYLLQMQGGHLCDIVRDICDKRQRVILNNPNFRNQLEQFSQIVITNEISLTTG